MFNSKSDIRKEIAIYAILMFIANFNFTLIVPSIKELVIEQFNTNEVVASLFITVEMIAYIIFGMIWGALSDKQGKRKKFIVIGLAGSAVMYFTMTLANSLDLLIAFRFIQGAISIMAWSLIMTSVLDIASKTSYGRVMGSIGCCMALGIGFGAPVGGKVADVFGMFAPLYLASILFLVATIISLKVKEHKIKHKPKSIFRAIKVLREKKKLAIPYAYGFVDRFTSGFFVFVFPLFMAEVHNASSGMRGMYLSIFLLPFALLQYPFGKLSDKIGRTPPLVLGSLFYGILVGTIGFTVLIGQEAKKALGLIMLGCGILAAMMFPPSIALAS